MDSPTTYLGLLRGNADFRRVWCGQVVSFLGDWLTLIALYDIVKDMTGSALAVAGVTVAKTLPVFLIMPVAGPLIDRFDRRKLMLMTDFARAALAVGLAVSYLAGSLVALFGVLVLQMAFAGIFIPARTAVIPQVAPAQQIPVAMALSAGTWSVMLALGAALGGLATEFLGPGETLLLDAATFLLSAAFLWRLPRLPPRAAGQAAASTTFVDGLRYLRRKPYLAVLVSLKSQMALGAGVLVMIPFFGEGVFPATAGPVFVGLLFASRGLGALTGSMGVRRVFGDSPATMRAWIAPAYAITACSLVGLAHAPTLPLAAAAILLAAVGNGCLWVFSGTLAQQNSDQQYRGRVFALEFGTMTLVTSGMCMLAGYAVDRGLLDPRGVALWSGIALIAPILLWLLAATLLRRRDARIVAAPVDGVTPTRPGR